MGADGERLLPLRGSQAGDHVLLVDADAALNGLDHAGGRRPVTVAAIEVGFCTARVGLLT